MPRVWLVVIEACHQPLAVALCQSACGHAMPRASQLAKRADDGGRRFQQGCVSIRQKNRHQPLVYHPGKALSPARTTVEEVAAHLNIAACEKNSVSVSSSNRPLQSPLSLTPPQPPYPACGALWI